MGITGYRPSVKGICALVAAGVFLAASPAAQADNAGAEPKSIRKTCGQCPDGYAITGVTEAPSICKDGDPTLVECVPLGANLLAVCGACPDGYQEVGRSSVPSRCGRQEGGKLSQCQLQKFESTLPDPSQGRKTCPPDCGSTATPGQGAIPPPTRYLPTPEKQSGQ
ncbi:conserved exported protein of unknown function [Nitrospira japonica]|uniref:Uncharacterized protein n=1 Tax=Nitrospira japonica TaxID=1325564 RepID=A0A1W1I3R5_9BACT|nr:hypothetical protein [Nitrospira japonica]SLM47642.1 conserved exported protein of unknown function [Nitrospira japonica]